jgi:hypothetical protein
LPTRHRTGWYRTVNSALRFGSITKEVRWFARTLTRALRKLFQYQDMVWRGIWVDDLDAFVAAYEEGNIKTFPAFTSSSKERNLAFSGNVLFSAASYNGRDVELFSYYPEEKEVIFLSGTQFKIVFVERVGDRVAVDLDEVRDEQS